MHDAVDIQHRIVEVKRCLRAKTCALRNPERIARPLHQINHAAMGDGHALGHARGTAGEQHIEQVGIYVHRPALPEQRCIHAVWDCVIAAKLGIPGNAVRHLLVVFLVENHSGAQGVGNHLNPCPWHRGIKRRIEAPGAYRAQHGAQAVRALVHKNEHRLLRLRLRGKQAAGLLRRLPNLFPCHGFAGRVKGNVPRGKPGCLLQPVQHIAHAHRF